MCENLVFFLAKHQKKHTKTLPVFFRPRRRKTFLIWIHRLWWAICWGFMKKKLLQSYDKLWQAMTTTTTTMTKGPNQPVSNSQGFSHHHFLKQNKMKNKLMMNMKIRKILAVKNFFSVFWVMMVNLLSSSLLTYITYISFEWLKNMGHFWQVFFSFYISYLFSMLHT